MKHLSMPIKQVIYLYMRWSQTQERASLTKVVKVSCTWHKLRPRTRMYSPIPCTVKSLLVRQKSAQKSQSKFQCTSIVSMGHSSPLQTTWWPTLLRLKITSRICRVIWRRHISSHKLPKMTLKSTASKSARLLSPYKTTPLTKTKKVITARLVRSQTNQTAKWSRRPGRSAASMMCEQRAASSISREIRMAILRCSS